MDRTVAPQVKDSERAELESVLTALARTPRLESFLRYIAERYFQNRISEINEYNLATEVLGRSKSSFDAARDSIARVEAHRLRKRLKEYYETDGKEHEIQISLPQGSYVPAFTPRVSSLKSHWWLHLRRMTGKARIRPSCLFPMRKRRWFHLKRR